MATIITKNSSTAGAVPIAGDLVQGEIAVNVTDKKLYTKNASGSVVQITPTVNDNGFKNRIINGSMMIDQRNAGGSVTPTTSGTYSLDRWRNDFSQASKFSIQQNAGSITPPSGFKNYLGVTSLAATTVGASDYFFLSQVIEGYNASDFGFGAVGASTVTLSFWIRSSLTGTFGGCLRNGNGTRSYPFSYTINFANTWEQKSITITGDTTGTWATDNTAGPNVMFSLGVGSTFSNTSGAWVAGNYFSATGATSVVGTNGATFYITGVQLEKGSTATSFDYRPYGTELALCQRYCWKYDSSVASGAYSRFSYGEASSTVQYQGGLFFPVQMRTTPSLTTASSSNYAIFSRATVTACNSGPTIGDGTTVNSGLIVAGVASGLTAGSAGSFMANNNNTAYLLYTAEL